MGRAGKLVGPAAIGLDADATSLVSGLSILMGLLMLDSLIAAGVAGCRHETNGNASTR